MPVPSDSASLQCYLRFKMLAVIFIQLVMVSIINNNVFFTVFKPGNICCNDLDTSQHKGETKSVFLKEVSSDQFLWLISVSTQHCVALIDWCWIVAGFACLFRAACWPTQKMFADRLLRVYLHILGSQCPSVFVSWLLAEKSYKLVMVATRQES